MADRAESGRLLYTQASVDLLLKPKFGHQLLNAISKATQGRRTNKEPPKRGLFFKAWPC